MQRLKSCLELVFPQFTIFLAPNASILHVVHCSMTDKKQLHDSAIFLHCVSTIATTGCPPPLPPQLLKVDLPIELAPLLWLWNHPVHITIVPHYCNKLLVYLVLIVASTKPEEKQTFWGVPEVSVFGQSMPKYPYPEIIYLLKTLIHAAARLSSSIILGIRVAHVICAVELAEEPGITVAVVHAHLANTDLTF